MSENPEVVRMQCHIILIRKCVCGKDTELDESESRNANVEKSLNYSERLTLACRVAGSWSDEADLLWGKACSWPSEVLEGLLRGEADC